MTLTLTFAFRLRGVRVHCDIYVARCMAALARTLILGSVAFVSFSMFALSTGVLLYKTEDGTIAFAAKAIRIGVTLTGLGLGLRAFFWLRALHYRFTHYNLLPTLNPLYCLRGHAAAAA